MNVNRYNQQIRGALELKGQSLAVATHFEQEGRVEVGGGAIHVKGNVTQKGFFNIQKGKLFVDGNLIINGETLRDEAFTENRSLNVGGGLVQVGSAESMAVTREKGILDKRVVSYSSITVQFVFLETMLLQMVG